MHDLKINNLPTPRKSDSRQRLHTRLYFSVFTQTCTSIHIHRRDSQSFLFGTLLGIINVTPAQVNKEGAT